MNKTVHKYITISKEEELIIDNSKKMIRANPSGKLSIQSMLNQLSGCTDDISDILVSLKYQRIFIVDEMETILAVYSKNKIGMFKEKEIYYKFLNEGSDKTTKYKELKTKQEVLDIYIQRLEKSTWDIKDKLASLRISHNTDY